MADAELLDRLRTFLAGSPPAVRTAYLFGSTARGEERAGSDIDLGLLYDVPPAPTLRAQPFDLERSLERITGRPVQVVALNTAPVDLVHRVLEDGILLLDRDPGRRIQFEVRSRNEYFDLLPYLRMYRKLDATPSQAQ